jgi:hypothetical protein
MENIHAFLTAITKLGVPTFEQFQTIDLYEAKNLRAVVDCIFAVSRHAAKAGFTGRLLGPRLAERRSMVFNARQLAEARNIIPKQAGFAARANASGVTYGGRREIVSKPVSLGDVVPGAGQVPRAAE